MSQSASAGGPRPGLYSRCVLLMLFLVLATSLIGRNVLGILLEEVESDLDISDAQLG